MKSIKGILIALLMFGFMGVSQAYQKNAYYQLVIDSRAVAGTASIYSDAILVSSWSNLGFIFTVHKDTVTTDVKLEIQVIDSNTSDFSVIGSTNDASIDMNYDVTYSTNNYDMQWTDLASNGTLVSSLTSGKIADGITLPVTRWVRFKVTGNATNEPTSGPVRVSLTISRYGDR